jgi:hypothetical protein
MTTFIMSFEKDDFSLVKNSVDIKVKKNNHKVKFRSNG